MTPLSPDVLDILDATVEHRKVARVDRDGAAAGEGVTEEDQFVHRLREAVVRWYVGEGLLAWLSFRF